MLVALAKEELLKSLQQEQLVNKDLGTLITCDIIEMTVKRAIDNPQDKEKEEELMTRKINYLRSLEENYVQQEQPEVDLENYLENYFKGWHIEEEIGLTKPDGWSCIVDDLKELARHFYELGLNSRKK